MTCECSAYAGFERNEPKPHSLK